MRHAVLTIANLALFLTVAAPVRHALSAQSGERVEGSAYGLVGDGRTDNTEAFRRLLGDGNRTIHIARGDYVTGKLVIPGNTVLLLDPGTTLRDSGRLGPNDSLTNILADNVRIRGYGARIIADRHDYTTGESRHGIFIYGAAHVEIDGLTSSGHGGDGFYIGGSADMPAEDITLRDCTASNNQRQGLSIISARRVQVIDCRFDHTKGTAPQFGIDLEPNHPTNVLEQISIIRPVTDSNFGGGILIALGNLNDSSRPVVVTIIDHKSINEKRPLRKVIPHPVPNTIRYSAHR